MTQIEPGIVVPVSELLPVPVAPAPGKRERITDKDPATKLAPTRLDVLQLAQELGSVSKACRQAGMDRTSKRNSPVTPAT